MGSTCEEMHRERMRELVAFTAESFDTPYPSPFGAAVYTSDTGELVAQACDTVMRCCDPTNHAEINAIRLATKALDHLWLRGCVLYSTCEPCPMCMSACIWAEVDSVVYGASTMEDAHPYWPQSSDVAPRELVSRMRIEPRCKLVPHIERSLCQDLFKRCDALRQEKEMPLPPHR